MIVTRSVSSSPVREMPDADTVLRVVRWQDVSHSVLQTMSTDDVVALHEEIHRTYQSAHRSELAETIYGSSYDSSMSLAHAMLVTCMVGSGGRNHPYWDDLDDGTPIVEGGIPSDETLADLGLSSVDNWWGWRVYAYPWFHKYSTTDAGVAKVLSLASPPEAVIKAHWTLALARKELVTGVMHSLPAWLTRAEVDEARLDMAKNAASVSAWQRGWATFVVNMLKGTEEDAQDCASTVLGLVPGTADMLKAEFTAYETWKATWTAAYVNDLPDSSFLYVGVGGTKTDGKTSPRSLRKFPVKDAAGKVDVPHLRNALSRIPQSTLPAGDKKRVLTAARRMAATAGITVSKQTVVQKDEYRRLVTGAVLVPDVADAHNDVISADEIEKTAHSFLARYNDATKMGVQHNQFPDGIEMVESWLLKEEWAVTDDDSYPAGTWMMTVHVTNDDTWAAVLDGSLTCFSPAGTALTKDDHLA